MSSDLAVPRIGPASPAAATPREPTPTPEDAALEDAPARTAPATAFPNPTLRLDAGLAIVVIEFRDDTGAVRSTIPTQQQLEAYRSWERSQVGTPPPGAATDDTRQGRERPAEAGAAADGPAPERLPRAPDIAPPAVAPGAGAPDVNAAPDVNGLETLAD